MLALYGISYIADMVNKHTMTWVAYFIVFQLLNFFKAFSFQKESRNLKSLFYNYYYIKDFQRILETKKSSRICQPYYYPIIFLGTFYG